MNNSLKTKLNGRLLQAGAYEVRIADPGVGFEKAMPHKHPMDIWPACRSIVVFAVARPPKGNNTYIGPYAPWNSDRSLGPIPPQIVSCEFAMMRLSVLIADSITLKGISILQEKGFSSKVSSNLQNKLCAYEAGIGIYGRSGLILHPKLGNRMFLGVIMTDALLEPDPKRREFNPCCKCDLCIKRCPAHAYDPDKAYPESWSYDKCMAKRKEISQKGLYCHNCFEVCPAGEYKDWQLLSVNEVNTYLYYEKHTKVEKIHNH